MTDKSEPSFLQTAAPAALTPNPTYRERAYKDEYRPPVEERWIEDIADRHLEDLGARLPLGVVIPDEAGRAIRGTILAALEEALS